MKEVIIVFLVALAISSLFNGWNPFATNTPTDQTVIHQANVESSDQTSAASQAAQQAAPSNNPTTPNGSAL